MRSNVRNDITVRKEKRNIEIQLLRALAIICVVMIHTTPGVKGQLLTRPFTNLSVATFIFLSGYLTSININNIFSFYKRRIIRVFIPYVIWTALYMIVYKGSFHRFFYYLLTAKIAPQMYFILIYIQLVLISPFLKKIILSKWRWVGWVITPLATILFKYLPYFLGIQLKGAVAIFWSNCFLRYFLYYYLGLLLGNRIIKPKFRTGYLVVLYFISIIIQILESFLWYRLGEAGYASQSKFSVFLTATIFILLAYNFIESKAALKENIIIKLGIKIGDYSFGIYLCHMLIKYVLIRYVPLFNQIPFGVNSLIIVLVSLVTVLLGKRMFG